MNGNFAQRFVRKANLAVVGGFKASEDPLESWFGRVLVGLPNEVWPTVHGRAMMPLAQFNLTELDDLPAEIGDLAMITLFIDPSEAPNDYSETGNGWAIRAYPSLDGLEPIPEPFHSGSVESHPIRWELVDDYPAWEDASPLGVPEEEIDEWLERHPNVVGTKIGGWPGYISGAIRMATTEEGLANCVRKFGMGYPQFVFQIGAERRAKFGHNSIHYFGRRSEPRRAVWMYQRQQGQPMPRG